MRIVASGAVGTWALMATAVNIMAAPVGSLSFTAAPDGVVPGAPALVTVTYTLDAGSGPVPLNIELKDPEAVVVAADRQSVQGAGRLIAQLTLPPNHPAPWVQFAAWLGTDWQNPIGEIRFTDHIPVMSRQDADRLRAARATQQAEANQFFAGALAPENPRLNALLLDDPAFSAAGSQEASVLEPLLKNAGYQITRINVNALQNPMIVTHKRFGLLAITNAGRLPVDAGQAVEAFIQAGGSLVVLGAPAWKAPVTRAMLNGRPQWVDADQYAALVSHVQSQHNLVNFGQTDLSKWTPGSNAPVSHAEYAVQDGALHVTIPNLTGWETFRSPSLSVGGAALFQAGQTLTCFRARGDGRTDRLALEWDEKDGSRWIATVPLTAKWQNYSLPPADFHYWESVPSRATDRFRPSHADRLSVGLAFTHTGLQGGAHEYWIADIGTAEDPLGGLTPPAAPAVQPVEGLFPTYKFFVSHGVRQIVLANGPLAPGMAGSSQQANDSLAGGVEAAGQNGGSLAFPVESLQPRPGASGILKNRIRRFIPLMTSVGEKGAWRGIPAALILPLQGPERGAACLSVAIADPQFYEMPAVKAELQAALVSMSRGVFITEAGADHYTYFTDQQVLLGGSVLNSGDIPENAALQVDVTDTGGKSVFSKTWTLTAAPGQQESRIASWKPGQWPDAGYHVTVTLSDAASHRELDRVTHSIYAWSPPAHPDFITAHDGQFWLDGKPWKAHGINYMPSSGIGLDDSTDFEYWIDRSAYDPEIIDRDLQHIRDMGLNAVSVFIYRQSLESQNLVDLLRRCHNLGIHASVSLRPGTPMDFQWSAMRDIIETDRLAQNDTVFAYGLAWEPSLGGHVARKQWDTDWRLWISSQYGSLEAAQKDWGFPAPVEDGQVTNPLDSQTVTDGPWTRMVIAYRRFTDDLLTHKYGEARRLVRTVDPNHLVSFRMAETGDPTNNGAGSMPYDMAGIAPAVDFLAPEAYGRIGDWDQVKPGWFERDYARWAAPGKPMTWAEMGMSVWDRNTMDDDPKLLQRQGSFFDAFYQMMIRSGCNGIFYWWYPGGFRVGENSDFGVINPDGTDRPATVAIRSHAREFLDAPMPPAPNAWIEFSRDRRASGIAGIYDDTQGAFWKSIAAGQTPGLKTPGTGTNSRTAPATAVGGGAWTGKNPSRFLNAWIESVTDEPHPTRAPVEAIRKPAGAPDTASTILAQLANTGEAAWLPGKSPDETGTVWLVATVDTGSWWYPIPAEVGHLGTLKLSLQVPAGPLSLSVVVAGRGRIGDAAPVVSGLAP